MQPHGRIWREAIIHNFANSAGSRPWASVTLDGAGNVYGTTLYNGPGETGSGVDFELSQISGKWQYKIIHNLNNGGGGGPFGGLIFDTAGNLYGTTYGEGSCAATVYELFPQTNGTWKETVLHKFTETDGCQIYGGLAIDSAGNIYGTTAGGGTDNAGTVFELSNSQGKWLRHTLYNFLGGSDGASSFAGVILDSSGDVYGTTYAGGSSGAGTVFEVIP